MEVLRSLVSRDVRPAHQMGQKWNPGLCQVGVDICDCYQWHPKVGEEGQWWEYFIMVIISDRQFNTVFKSSTDRTPPLCLHPRRTDHPTARSTDIKSVKEVK